MAKMRATPLVLLLCAVAWADSPGQPANRDAGPLLDKLFPTLEDTLELVDRHEDLPKRTFLFGEDQRSNREKIDKLLDRAIESLEVSGLSESRATLRELEENTRAAQRRINEYERKRIAAPAKDTLGLIDKANPFLKTREDYDEMIASERENIEARRGDLTTIRTEFAAGLRAIGLELDDNAVDGLLSSVSGDDIVSMAIVFDNVKNVTEQLEQLTQKSGEDLDTAKRYYGLYVVLVEVLDRIQKQFVAQVNEVHIPALEEFGVQALKNIEEARRQIKKRAGDERVLRSNIAANEMTAETAKLYTGYLREQAAMVAAENAEVERTLATAMNTYRTVKLSSDVATLIKTGREDFDTLMRLRLPYLREFQNEAVRREFQRMTEQLRTLH